MLKKYINQFKANRSKKLLPGMMKAIDREMEGKERMDVDAFLKSYNITPEHRTVFKEAIGDYLDLIWPKKQATLTQLGKPGFNLGNYLADGLEGSMLYVSFLRTYEQEFDQLTANS